MMLEPMVEESEWMQCTACNQWRLLPPGMSADGLPEQWFCHMEPFNRNCDVTEVVETLPDSVIAGPNKSSAPYTDCEIGEEPICTSKSSFEIFVPKRKRTAVIRNRREFRVYSMQVAHKGPLDNGRTFSPKKTKLLQRSIESCFPKKTLLIQKSIKDLFLKKRNHFQKKMKDYFRQNTKLVQKRIKDFFPKIKYFDAMRNLRQSRVNCVNRDATEGNSRTVIMNITAGFRRSRGRSRKVR